MANYTYPLFVMYKPYDLIIMFTGLTVGEVVQKGKYTEGVGYKSQNFAPHTDSMWTPCADPRQTKKQKLMVMLKDFR